MKEASYYRREEKGSVTCSLCPHNCRIKEGKRGVCQVRKNIDGRLFSENYGLVSASHLDPVEKKPLYHYFPGTTILSIGSFGCNLHCKFCQNAGISQSCLSDIPNLNEYSSRDILQMALSTTGNIGIAYTYNEPAIWFEYMIEVAGLAKSNHLKNVMVTNGFISQEPLLELLPLMDAFSVDLKAFTEDFYRTVTGSRLKPVLETLETIGKAKRHLEITNLVIPGLNDDVKTFTKMCRWIQTTLGRETVLHLSRYFPTYKMTIESTPVETLTRLFEIAREYLDYAYIGNVHLSMGRDTVCSNCGQIVIRRDGYWTSKSGLDNNGRCLVCGNQVAVME
jgi:pyruvate formate lyase activating enzyme